MAIDTTKKIKQVTYNGTEIPLRGYDTSDATVTAGDMAYGVVAYGKNGKVTGTLTKVEAGTSQTVRADEVKEMSAEIYMHGTVPVNVIFKAKSGLNIGAKPSEFGNATAADVAKGKTFTSAAGLKVVGTAEGSSSRPVDIGLENTDFTEVWVGFVRHNENMSFVTISNGQTTWISVEEGSVVVVVNTAFDGEEFDFVSNGHITDTTSTSNVAAFIADYSLSGKLVELLMK